MFTLKHKVFFGLSIYVILALHVYILFPQLSITGLLFQACLRWLVLGAALLCTNILLSSKSNHRFIIFKWIAWLMIIPYPVYNIFQVRHIAEIFHLNEFEHFAPGTNVDVIWKCLPTLAYAFISGYLGFNCIYKVAEKYFRTTYTGLFFSIIILNLSSAASLYGLHSRLDTYHLFTQPFMVLSDFLSLFSQKQPFINYLFCTVFFIFCYIIYYLILKSLPFINQRKHIP